MAMKSLKSKVAVGVLATGLIAGMGSVFAATDISGQFQSWYKTNFTNTVTVPVTANAAVELKNQLSGYATEFTTLTASSNQAIVSDQKAQSNTSMTTINSKKNDYVNQVTNAKNDIKNNQIGRDTQNLIGGLNFVGNIAVKGAEVAGQLSLNSDLDAQGKESVKQVKKDVAAYQASSTGDLASKIQAAKDELKILIDQSAATADAEVRKNLEQKIAELRKTLSDYAAKQVTENKALVKAAADTDTAAALKALEDVANSINK